MIRDPALTPSPLPLVGEGWTRSGRGEGCTDHEYIAVPPRAEQWSGRGPFKAWLFRIATHQALNHLRAVHRRREQPLEGSRPSADQEDEGFVPGDLIDASALGPDALMEQAEQRGLLRRFIDELPEEKREVFRMIHDAEMEVREVAERLGIPEGTVKSRLHHARKRIARKWKDVL